MLLRISASVPMKSLLTGQYGLRTLLRRDGGAAGAVSHGVWWRSRGLGPGLPAYCTASKPALSSSKDSLVLRASSFAALRKYGLKSASFPMPSVVPSRSLCSVESSVVDLAAPATQPSSDAKDTDEFLNVAVKVADACGDIIRQLFRTKMDVADMEDESPVTVAESTAEYAMSLIISQHFPTHAMYAEGSGLQMHQEDAEYIWVMDPIYGAESFLSGKPLFGTLISLLHKGVPILGIVDQPIIRERWIGRVGKDTTLNGEPVTTRSSTKDIKLAYMFSSSPHLFPGPKQEIFTRLRDKVKVPQYGGDCYAYGLLASGYVDLVVESGLKPYDFLPLIPVIEGAGGYITDWQGQKLNFSPKSANNSSGGGASGGVEIVAAASEDLHKSALTVLAASGSSEVEAAQEARASPAAPPTFAAAQSYPAALPSPEAQAFPAGPPPPRHQPTGPPPSRYQPSGPQYQPSGPSSPPPRYQPSGPSYPQPPRYQPSGPSSPPPPRYQPSDRFSDRFSSPPSRYEPSDRFSSPPPSSSPRYDPSDRFSSPSSPPPRYEPSDRFSSPPPRYEPSDRFSSPPPPPPRYEPSDRFPSPPTSPRYEPFDPSSVPPSRYQPSDRLPPPSPRYEPSDRSSPRYEPSDRSSPRYEPSDRSSPRYEPSDRSSPRYEPSDRSPPRYEPSDRSPPRYEPSNRSSARFEPSDRSFSPSPTYEPSDQSYPPPPPPGYEPPPKDPTSRPPAAPGPWRRK